VKAKAPFSTAIAIGFGLLTLLAYFLPNLLGFLRDLLIEWALGIVAFALLIGVVNLLAVHWRKVRSGAKGVYSAVLILSFAVTLIVVAWNKPTGQWSLWLFDYVQIPVEASLMAVVAVALIYAAARLLRRRMNGMLWVFFITALLILAGSAPLYFVQGVDLQGLRSFIANALAVAGARGILLGVALGVVATGVRILLGADRPYSG